MLVALPRGERAAARLPDPRAHDDQSTVAAARIQPAAPVSKNAPANAAMIRREPVRRAARVRSTAAPATSVLALRTAARLWAAGRRAPTAAAKDMASTAATANPICRARDGSSVRPVSRQSGTAAATAKAPLSPRPRMSGRNGVAIIMDQRTVGVAMTHAPVMPQVADLLDNEPRLVTSISATCRAVGEPALPGTV